MATEYKSIVQSQNSAGKRYTVRKASDVPSVPNPASPLPSATKKSSVDLTSFDKAKVSTVQSLRLMSMTANSMSLNLGSSTLPAESKIKNLVTQTVDEIRLSSISLIKDINNAATLTPEIQQKRDSIAVSMVKLMSTLNTINNSHLIDQFKVKARSFGEPSTTKNSLPPTNQSWGDKLVSKITKAFDSLKSAEIVSVDSQLKTDFKELRLSFDKLLETKFGPKAFNQSFNEVNTTLQNINASEVSTSSNRPSISISAQSIDTTFSDLSAQSNLSETITSPKQRFLATMRAQQQNSTTAAPDSLVQLANSFPLTAEPTNTVTAEMPSIAKNNHGLNNETQNNATNITADKSQENTAKNVQNSDLQSSPPSKPQQKKTASPAPESFGQLDRVKPTPAQTNTVTATMPKRHGNLAPLQVKPESTGTAKLAQSETSNNTKKSVDSLLTSNAEVSKAINTTETLAKSHQAAQKVISNLPPMPKASKHNAAPNMRMSGG